MPADDEVGFVGETLALRTNHICSKGLVESALPANTERSEEPASETFVPSL
jgi:hypothetical protein